MVKNDLLAGLTSEQRKAVTHRNGPALVVAGAGTGKTSVITMRIVWLIKNKLAKPSEILALTFTEKAANEMIIRVDQMSDSIYGDLNISTFHSFGSEIISEFSYELGLPPDAKVLSTAEQILFIKENIFGFNFKHYKNLGDPLWLVRDLVKVFSRAKDEALMPDDYIKGVQKKLKQSKDKAEREENEKHLELARAYKKYNDLLHRNGYIDYGDQNLLLLALLKKPSIKKKLQDRYKYALVDEFQDTNFAQSKLIFEIFGRNGNVMAVGDDDQSIYRFRGAAISNILNFKKTYQNVKTYVLQDNFRSTQQILDVAHKFIKHNNPDRLEYRYRINKNLKSHNGKGKKPILKLFDRESQEANFVVQEIISGIKKGKKFSDFAILVRSNRNAEEFILALKREGIPFVFSGTESFYEKTEIKNLISLINILCDPNDDIALYHLAVSEIFKADVKDVAKMSQWAKRNNRPLEFVFENAKDLAGELSLSQKTQRKVHKIIEILNLLREESRTATAGEIVNLFLKESGYYKKITEKAYLDSVESYEKVMAISSFFDKIIHFQKNYRDHSLIAFYNYLNVLMEIGGESASFEPAEDIDAVNVLTIHKAKGLEFETVFLGSLSKNHIPVRFSSGIDLPSYLINEETEYDKDKHIQEERRLFYVAMTRAKKNLYFLASLDYGTKKTHTISPFVREALGDKEIEKRFLKSTYIDRIESFSRNKDVFGVRLSKVSPKEKIVLSSSSIDDYLTCPLKYKLIHITPINIISDVQVSYGNAIHGVISDYYKKRLGGKKVSEKEIEESFDIFWDESGFLSKKHEEDRYKHGLKSIKKFYRKAEASALPIASEKSFKFNLGNNIIKGRYDAIFEEDGKIKIVDFKTTYVVKDQKDADERAKKSTQLAIYSLSWFMNHNQLPTETQLYFIEKDLIGRYSHDEKSLEKTKDMILKVADGIRKRDFTPQPSLRHCSNCPFKYYCPKAYLRKSED